MITLECNDRSIIVKEQNLPEQELDIKIWTRRTMAGDLRTWKHANCHLRHRLDLLFASATEYYAFCIFVKYAFGREVKFTDDSDNVEMVRFVNNPVVISRPRREMRVVTIELEEI